ncbi:U32 family peptidase [Deefgea piscis]|uniref:Ubiquinone biosynthesis protein UbiV n=1 Tax=Deefgea piscis TaxID=2739061 RepID=A0A6M8SS58_9NEIS|nr:U32 family peptidase [Deefgea piscis]QKJ66146.1 U32 family peptidase [Deefgea piscis]
MQLTLGPLLYYWSRQATLDFYAAAADWNVSTIYLGEVVCARRHELRTSDWLALGQQLCQAGKTVVYSSQALLESGSDLSSLRRFAKEGGLLEANDLGAVKIARDLAIPYIAGPHLNIYNGATLDWHQAAGAIRWLPSLEASRAAIVATLAEAKLPIETEIFAHGRLPLAFSARCFTARHYDLSKDACEFKCIEHADGQLLKTREGQDFLRLNGIQTQSAACHALIHDLASVTNVGASHLRISPQAQFTAEIVAAYAAALANPATAPELDWQRINPEGLVNGYWHGQAGICMKETV